MGYGGGESCSGKIAFHRGKDSVRSYTHTFSVCLPPPHLSSSSSPPPPPVAIDSVIRACPWKAIPPLAPPPAQQPISIPQPIPHLHHPPTLLHLLLGERGDDDGDVMRGCFILHGTGTSGFQVFRHRDVTYILYIHQQPQGKPVEDAAGGGDSLFFWAADQSGNPEWISRHVRT